MSDWLQTYTLMFVFLLVVGYLAPAGVLHWLTVGRGESAMAGKRIQARRARPHDIWREVRHSLIALLFFAAYCVPLFSAAQSGRTALYWQLADYPLIWLPLSFVACLVLHDTYFYWTHRLMHTRWLYRAFHAGHHRSLAPTPWAILAFQPLETVPQFAFFALLILFVPLHPAVLLTYFIFDGLINAAGHCGYEIVPTCIRNHPLLRYANAVTHHDLHHARFNYNFGQYFNVWDRVMGTFLNQPDENRVDASAPQNAVTSRPRTL